MHCTLSLCNPNLKLKLTQNITSSTASYLFFFSLFETFKPSSAVPSSIFANSKQTLRFEFYINWILFGDTPNAEIFFFPLFQNKVSNSFFRTSFSLYLSSCLLLPLFVFLSFPSSPFPGPQQRQRQTASKVIESGPPLLI